MYSEQLVSWILGCDNRPDVLLLHRSLASSNTRYTLTIRVHLRSFSSCCLPNLRNRAKFSENSNFIQGHRSWCQSKDYMSIPFLVINSNIGRISYRFRDIDAYSSKMACFPTPTLFDAPKRMNAIRYQRNLYTASKCI